MAWTDQYRVLTLLQQKYGKTAYTREHQNYKMVGFKRHHEDIHAIGDTWEEAMDNLSSKVKK